MTQDLLTHSPAAVSTTPAGWYADPVGAGTLRWWSGAGWTEHTAMANPPAVAQAAPDAAAPVAPAVPAIDATGHEQPAVPLSRRRLRELAQQSENPAVTGPTALFTTDTGAETSTPTIEGSSSAAAASVSGSTGAARPAQVIDLRDESGYVDVSVARAPVSVFTPLWPTRVHTVAGWLIALLPLLLAAVEKASAILLVDVSPLIVRVAGAGSLVVLSGILAVVDRHMLRAGGHSDTASPWWVLLTPFAYLIARSVRVRQETSVRSTGPALIWLVSLLPAIAMIVGVARLEAMIPAF